MNNALLDIINNDNRIREAEKKLGAIFMLEAWGYGSLKISSSAALYDIPDDEKPEDFLSFISAVIDGNLSIPGRYKQNPPYDMDLIY